MYKLIVLFVMILFVNGCATLPSYRGMYQANSALDSFWKDIKNHEYEDSYGYFTDELKLTVKLEQHSAFMKTLEEKLGPMTSYKLLVPRGVFLNEKIMESPFRNGGSVYLRYAVKYNHAQEPIDIWLEVFKKDGHFSINAFNVKSDKLQDDPDFQRKVQALGITLDNS